MTATINVCVPLIHYALWICVPEDYSWAHCASASWGCYLDIPEHNAIVEERFFKNKVEQSKTLTCTIFIHMGQSHNYKSLCQVLLCSLVIGTTF